VINTKTESRKDDGNKTSHRCSPFHMGKTAKFFHFKLILSGIIYIQIYLYKNKVNVGYCVKCQWVV